MPATLRRPDGTVHGTFIAIHGLGGWKDQPVMRTIADALSDSGYLTVTFDEANGANAPDAARKGSTTTRYLQDVADVVEFVTAQDWYQAPLSLAGHSLGALAASEYAAEHPGMLARLVLIAPALHWRSYPHFILFLAAWWLLTNQHRMQGPNPGGFVLGRAWLIDFHRFNAYKKASRIDVPALVVIGEHDGLVGTLATHERYAKLLPKGHLEIVPGTTHEFTRAMPALAATIKQWLTSS